MSAAAQPLPVAPDVSRRAVLRLAQLRAVFALNLRIALRGKRIWVLALVAFLPALMPVGQMVLAHSPLFAHAPRFPPAMSFFQSLIGSIYLRLILYVLALACGLAIVSDEVESKTLVHLVLRPLPRWVVVVGKFLVAWFFTALLLVGSLVFVYALAWMAQQEAGAWKGALAAANLRILLLDSALFVLALAAYLALSSCVGAWLPHGERWGVVFCFGWEYLITYMPARIKYLTLMYHLQTLFPHSVSVTKFFSLSGEPLSKTLCLVILVAATIGFFALTVWNLKRREIR